METRFKLPRAPARDVRRRVGSDRRSKKFSKKSRVETTTLDHLLLTPLLVPLGLPPE
jgi:hypothetical protein